MPSAYLHNSLWYCQSRHSSCHCWRTWGRGMSRMNRWEQWRECARSIAARWGTCSSEDGDKSEANKPKHMHKENENQDQNLLSQSTIKNQKIRTPSLSSHSNDCDISSLFILLLLYWFVHLIQMVVSRLFFFFKHCTVSCNMVVLPSEGISEIIKSCATHSICFQTCSVVMSMNSLKI